MNQESTVLEAGKRLVRGLQPDVTYNPFTAMAAAGSLRGRHLLRLVDQERAVIASATVPLLTMAARHRGRLAEDYFLGILAGLRADESALSEAAASLRFHHRTSGPGIDATAHAYIGYISWLALHASQAATALMIYAEFTVWSRNCVRLRKALLPGVATGELLAYLDAYREPSADLLAASVSVAAQGLDRGDDLTDSVRSAALLKGYARMFWAGAAAEPPL